MRVRIVIRRFLVQVPPWPPAGFVLGRPQFKSSATLVTGCLLLDAVFSPVMLYLNRPFSIFKIHTWVRGLRNKTKQMYYSLLSLKMISFVLFPQASEPSMNFGLLFVSKYLSGVPVK